MSLDELDRVARERLIGSPPHSFQLLGTMERLRYLERIGTMGALGTVLLTVRVGTIGKVNRLGTVHYQERLGTVGGRDFSGVALRDQVPLGPGSIWAGGWQDIAPYLTKSFAVLSQGAGGSFSIVTGLVGTGLGGLTGTYYGPAWIAADNRVTKSFVEAMQYTRPVFRRSGASRGTVSVGLSKQV